MEDLEGSASDERSLFQRVVRMEGMEAVVGM